MLDWLFNDPHMFQLLQTIGIIATILATITGLIGRSLGGDKKNSILFPVFSVLSGMVIIILSFAFIHSNWSWDYLKIYALISIFAFLPLSIYKTYTKTRPFFGIGKISFYLIVFVSMVLLITHIYYKYMIG